jgi:hypothetical protein
MSFSILFEFAMTNWGVGVREVLRGWTLTEFMCMVRAAEWRLERESGGSEGQPARASDVVPAGTAAKAGEKLEELREELGYDPLEVREGMRKAGMMRGIPGGAGGSRGGREGKPKPGGIGFRDTRGRSAGSGSESG